MTQNITQKNYVDSYGEFFCKIGFPVIFVSPFATTIHDLVFQMVILMDMDKR